MGNRTCRNISQKNSRRSRTSTSNNNFDQQRFNKLHIDLHCNAMDKVLNHHLLVMDSIVDIQQRVMNLHKEALNIAIRHHLNAVYFQSANYPQTQQIIYTF